MEKNWLKSYPSDIPKDIHLDEQRYPSLVALLDESCTHFSDRTAFLMMGSRLSFAQLKAQSDHFSSYLQQLGLHQGDRIAFVMPNILQYPIALLGAHKAGLIVVPCNPLYTQHELQHQLHDAGATAIIIVENFMHTLVPILEHTSIQHILVTSIGEMMGWKGIGVDFLLRHIKKVIPTWHAPQAVWFKSALDIGSKHPHKPIELLPDDIAFLQYTGGTTGVSKGVVLTHRNMLYNIMQAAHWVSCKVGKTGEMIVTALPLYHIFALTANCFTMMRLGVTNLLIINARDIPAMIREMKKNPWTILTAVNTLFNALLNHADFAHLDFSRLRFCLGGGMAVQKKVATHWQQVTGTPIVQAYGLSETSPALTINLLDDDFNGSVGLPVSSTTITIRDEQGKILPIDNVGEICAEGPQVMREYWNKPRETQKVFWQDEKGNANILRTGDMGRIDSTGRVFLVDRLKDMIVVSGFKVFPNEVEDVLAAHPAVLECGVVGVSDNRTGEAVKAYIVKRSQHLLTADDLDQYCHQYLTNYKVPKYFQFIETLPKNNVGKVLRKSLKDMQ